MSGGAACRCAEARKPVRERSWEVTARHRRCSAFDGYRVRESRYSEVHCRACAAIWRTAARYVAQLRDAPEDWYLR